MLLFNSPTVVDFSVRPIQRTVLFIFIYLILLYLYLLSPVEANTTEMTFFKNDRADSALSGGYAILIQGSLPTQEGLEAYNETLNRVYHRLRQSDFEKENIIYFNYDDRQTQVNAIPNEQAFLDSIEIWAANKMNSVPAPLYIIMVDHGNADGFFIDDKMITPLELKTSLAKLEVNLNEAALNMPRVIIIGASYSGTFIPKLSEQGRIIITSATAKEASQRDFFKIEGGGELFIDIFFELFWRGNSLKESFVQASAELKILTRTDIFSAKTFNSDFSDYAKQHPLLDDNGDQKGSHYLFAEGDGQQADTLFLTEMDQKKRPDNEAKIVAVTPTLYLDEWEKASVLFLEANDPHFVDSAHILIRSPSKKTHSELLYYNAESKRFEIGYRDFNDPGRYDIFYIAKHDLHLATFPKHSIVYKNHFDNASPEAFELISPADFEERQTYSLFDWETTNDPNGDGIIYQLILAEDEFFTRGVKIVGDLSSSMASLDHTIGLKNNSLYYWKVEAVDQFGAKTESEIRRFITNNHNDNYAPINISIRDELGFIPDPIVRITENDQPLSSEKQPDIAKDEGRGSYLFGFPIPGHYHLEINLDGFIPEIEPLHVIGQPDRLIKTLRPCPLDTCQLSPYEASGHIYDKRGGAIAGVKVEIGEQNDITDDSGFWKIIHLYEGEHNVIANKNGYIFSDKRCVIGNGENCSPDFSEPDSELDLKVVANPHSVEQGDQLSYTITVTNQGDETATDILLTEYLPVGTHLVSIEALNGGLCNAGILTCHLPDLTPGDFARAEVVISNSETKTLENYVTVMANEYPEALQITSTKVRPYLSLSITHAPDPIDIGKDLHYKFTAKLNPYAPTPATDIELVTILPKAVKLKSLNSDSANCDLSELPKITCSLIDLQPNSENSEATVNIHVVLTEPGLLMLIQEGKINANEYRTHWSKVRSQIAIPDDIQVDMSIVLDVSASMRQEVNEIIIALKNFIASIDPENAPLIALVVFRDDITIKAFTRDINVLLEAIDKIQISGGGACSEASIEALSIAIPHTKKEGSILFATDASPYDDANVEEIIEQLRNRGIRFNAMITGDCNMTESWNE
jgi:uncharacterized repeat protein (TIGR01451 family)